MVRSMEDMGDELCDFCSCPDENKGMHLGPNGPYGCEGRWCGEAYDYYLECEDEVDDD